MAGEKGASISPILNDLQFALANHASAIGTATTSDKFLMVDVDATADYEVKTALGTDILVAAGVTSTAAELNIMDGVTATAAELNNAADISAAQRAITATADGLSTGLLTTADLGRFLTITSSSANNIVMLPAVSTAFIGGTIEMWIGSNGFEIRATGTAATINGLDCKTTNEAAVAATHRVRLTVVGAEKWLLEGDTELGARVTIVPDAV